MLYKDERYNREFTGQTSTQFTDIVPRAKGMNFLYFLELDISKIDYDGSSRVFNFKGNRIDKFKANNFHIEKSIFIKTELNTYREKFPVLQDADDFNLL